MHLYMPNFKRTHFLNPLKSDLFFCWTEFRISSQNVVYFFLFVLNEITLSHLLHALME